MNPLARARLAQLRSDDRDLQNRAFHAILAETDHPVDCAYEAWDELVAFFL